MGTKNTKKKLYPAVVEIFISTIVLKEVQDLKFYTFNYWVSVVEFFHFCIKQMDVFIVYLLQFMTRQQKERLFQLILGVAGIDLS